MLHIFGSDDSDDVCLAGLSYVLGMEDKGSWEEAMTALKADEDDIESASLMGIKVGREGIWPAGQSNGPKQPMHCTPSESHACTRLSCLAPAAITFSPSACCSHTQALLVHSPRGYGPGMPGLVPELLKWQRADADPEDAPPPKTEPAKMR